MAYLGSTPETQTFTSGTDYFNGDGISVSFTLSRPVASVNDIDVVVSNVVQQPSTAYSVSGTTITFTSAPPAGTANVYARYLSTATQTLTPSPGTVGTSQISPSLTNVPFFGGSTLGAGNATGMKNRLINGGMVLDQRNAGASVTPANGAWTYAVDRFAAYVSQASKLTVQQVTDAPTGFSNSLKVTSSSSYSVTSADIFSLRQTIEGFNFQDFSYGTANAATFTLSFWVKSSLTGAFGGALQNSAGSRGYAFAYTINAADTWEQKTVTIVGDTTGTWVGSTNGIGISVLWGLGVGSTYSIAAGSWGDNSFTNSATGATSVVGTSGATFYVTGVQLEEGNAATSFDFRDYGRELALAQRYFEMSYDIGTALGTATSTGAVYRTLDNGPLSFASPGAILFKVTKRSAPTVVLYGANTGATATINVGGSDLAALAVNVGTNTAGAYVNNVSGGGAGASCSVHYTASSEL